MSTDDDQLDVTALIIDSRKIMEALGVDRPGDVLKAVRTLKLAQQHGVTARTDIERERDEARAAVERLKTELARVNALLVEATSAQPNPLVLRLPEVPEGTVALTGIESGHRYTPGKAAQDEGCWYDETSQMWHGHIGSVLGGEPEGVRVELAPPPAPEPRTAADVWDDMTSDERTELRRTSEFRELAEALDREAAGL